MQEHRNCQFGMAQPKKQNENFTYEQSDEC